MEQTCHSCQYQVTLKCDSKYHKKAATEGATDLVNQLSANIFIKYKPLVSI